LFSNHFINSRQKRRQYEAGFSTVGGANKSISVNFLVILCLFVLFDLELVLLIGFLVAEFSSVGILLLLYIFVLGGFYLE